MDAADAMARMFKAGERHPVDAEGGVVVEHHRRSVEALIDAQRRIQILGEHGGLEGNVEAVGPRDRLSERAEGIDADHRPEHFVLADARITRRVPQHCRCVTGLGEALAAGQHLGASGLGFFDPFRHPVHFAWANERADLGAGFGRIADLHRLGLFGQTVGHCFGDGIVREDTLDRDTHLSGVVEAALGQERQRAFHVRVRRHNDRRHAAMLERTARARRQFGAQHPAHAGAADKAEKADPGIGDDLLRYLDLGRDDRLAPLVRQARFAQYFDEAHAGKRRILGRLDEHRASHGYGGTDLVDDQIKRMIECAYRRHHADRLEAGECQAVHRRA